MISVRGAGELPLVLRAWIDAWVAQRGGRTGALVAIIGLPAQPDAQAHHTLQYFQAVARQAGLDFLPRERKLPEPPLVAAGLTARWLGSQLGRRPGRGAHWALTE